MASSLNVRAFFTRWPVIAIVAAACFLMLGAGCPNGGTFIPDINRPPSAHAGTIRNAEVGERVVLNGLASADPDGDAIAFRWNFIDGPVNVILEDATTALPHFVPTEPGVYEFSVVVDDGRGADDRDTTLVIVGGADPEPSCPHADAGSDVTVVEESGPVTLVGVASSDPTGGPLIYAWVQLPTTEGVQVTLSDATSTSPTFDAPTVEADTDLLFELTVTNATCSRADTVGITILDLAGPVSCDTDEECDDGLFCNGAETCLAGACADGASPCDDTQVCDEDQDRCDVPGPENRAPIADAGPDQNVQAGDHVSLDGGDSSDPNHDPLAYLWVQVSGMPVTLAGSDTATPNFTAPEVDGAEQLVFRLWVDDGALTSDPDDVIVNVLPPGADDDVRIGASWSSGGGSVRVHLEWTFPNGTQPSEETTDWGTSGMSALSWPRASVPDGLHWLTFDFQSVSGTTPYFADVRYTVDFLGYSFAFLDNIVTGTGGGIAIDVTAGEGRVLYNALVDAEQPGSGGPTDLPLVEVQAGWREGTGSLRARISLQRAGDSAVPGFTSDWGEFGFARIVIPATATLPDGTYTLTFELQSMDPQQTRFADVIYQVRFPDYPFDSPLEPRTLSSGTEHTIVLEASGGGVTEISNDWFD
ncbi:MAG: PKD domain-containing protein [Phycisphaerales bacterium]|nr:MAG: PKD domain-containing protein [Phycisphaerales bacterium]